MDQLPNKTDLNRVETELTNKMHLNAMKVDKKIHTHTREIQQISARLDEQTQAVSRLEEEMEKQKTNNSGQSVAEMRRR